MQKLNIDKAIILGRSVGGRVAIEFANEYEKKVKAIIL